MIDCLLAGSLTRPLAPSPTRAPAPLPPTARLSKHQGAPSYLVNSVNPTEAPGKGKATTNYYDDSHDYSNSSSHDHLNNLQLRRRPHHITPSALPSIAEQKLLPSAPWSAQLCIFVVVQRFDVTPDSHICLPRTCQAIPALVRSPRLHLTKIRINTTAPTTLQVQRLSTNIAERANLHQIPPQHPSEPAP